LLEEIHLSKNTFCSYSKPEYHRYDIILPSLDKINIRTIAEAKRNKAKRLSSQAYESRKAAGEKVKQADCEVEELIFRIMTYDHIPLNNIRKKNPKTIADGRDKVNFPAFQHWKFDENDQLACVGKSHWQGNVETGKFNKDHGQITNTLARMYIKLCERYATRGNVRGYCVDTETEALTKNGWLNIDQITENDTILSYSENELKWSKIKSIYRGEYSGLMHHITSRSVDFLITPEHKIVTSRGLVKAELVKQSDKIIVLGNAVAAPEEEEFSNDFVELAGWVMTEGCYQLGRRGEVNSISVYQNPNAKANRIRNCLINLGYKFSESGTTNLCFSINAENTRKFTSVFPTKNLTMEFILKLTPLQRELLINTMVDSDGWRRGSNMSYCQKDKEHIDLFQALLTLAGKKSNYHYVTDQMSFGKLTNYYSVNIFSKRSNKTKGECLDFNGGLNNGAGINRSQGKEKFPNVPTVHYTGKVWCPETEYGCFVARRNGKVYLTGNTYNDEMKGQAILQLTQIGLQFDESKSDNPFAYFTAAVTNSFVRIINLEKRNQNIRDDLLEINGMNPSYTRTNEDRS
jgi:hypothetical protein